MPRVGSQEVVQENICLATLVCGALALLQHCLRATKLEQNVLAYRSDIKCRLHEAV